MNVGIEDFTPKEIEAMYKGKASNFSNYPGMDDQFKHWNDKLKTGDYTYSGMGEPSIMEPTDVSNAFENFISRKKKESEKVKRAAKYKPNPYTIEKKNLSETLNTYYENLVDRKELYTEAGYMMRMYEITGDKNHLPVLGKNTMTVGNMIKLYELTGSKDVMAEIYSQTIPSLSLPITSDSTGNLPYKCWAENEHITKDKEYRLIKSRKTA